MDKKQPEAQERKFWKRLCALNRFSFFYMGGGVARASDKSGNWIDVHSAQEIVDDAECEVSTQHARITELESQLAQRFDAADVATAAAQGFRDGVASAASWISVDERLPEKNTEVLICFAELSIPSTGRYTASALDHEGWCYPQENHLWPGERPDFEDGGSPTVTHWMKLPEAPALLMERAMSDTTTPKGQALTPAIGVASPPRRPRPC